MSRLLLSFLSFYDNRGWYLPGFVYFDKVSPLLRLVPRFPSDRKSHGYPGIPGIQSPILLCTPVCHSIFVQRVV